MSILWQTKNKSEVTCNGCKSYIQRKRGRTKKSVRPQSNKKKILPDTERKTKRRYPKLLCPITGCAKIVARIENHLRATHRITDNKTYKRYLNEARKVVTELPSEPEDSDESFSEKSESDYRVFQRLLRNEQSYIKKFDGIPVDSEDSEDEDWLISQTHYWAKREDGKILVFMFVLNFLKLHTKFILTMYATSINHLIKQ